MFMGTTVAWSEPCYGSLRLGACRNLVCESRRAVYSVVSSIVGVAASILSIVTLGAIKNINEYADWTSKSTQILPRLFRASLRVINPKAEFFYERLPMGFFTEKVAHRLLERGHEGSWDNSFFERHVVSRGFYALHVVVSRITKILDFKLGVLASIASLLTLGTSKKINSFAYRHLTSPTHNFWIGMRGVVNPKAVSNSVFLML